MRKKEKRYFLTVSRLQKVPHLYKQIAMMKSINAHAHIHTPRETIDWIWHSWHLIAPGNAILAFEHDCRIPGWEGVTSRGRDALKTAEEAPTENEALYILKYKAMREIFNFSLNRCLDTGAQDYVFGTALSSKVTNPLLIRRFIKERLVGACLKDGITTKSVDSSYATAMLLLNNKRLNRKDIQDVSDVILQITLDPELIKKQKTGWRGAEVTSEDIKRTHAGTFGEYPETLQALSTETIAYLVDVALCETLVGDRYGRGEKGLRQIVLEAYKRKLLIKADNAVYDRNKNDIYLPNPGI